MEGALEAAGTIGNTAVRSVTDVLVGVAGGIREVVGSVWSNTQEEKAAPAEPRSPKARATEHKEKRGS
ncbi:MAG: hypothetical protein ACRERD_18005 [Candidatus Binatia bacterium]